MSRDRVPPWIRVRDTLALARRLSAEERTPFLPLEELERIRDRRVQSMVEHARDTVPAYRASMEERGLGVDDVHGADDLARLPLLGRDELGERPASFRSTAYREETCLRLRSGGSSGAPRTVLHDPEAVLANAAHGERERSIVARLTGARLGYREAVVAPPFGAAEKVQAFVRRRTLQPPGLRIERRYLSLLDPPRAVARALADFRPDVLHGFGSYLGELFRWIEEAGWHGPLPRVVTYSSDGMVERDRRAIRARFGLSVLATYQAVEAFKIGFECEAGGALHVNVDLYPVRLVDDRGDPVPDGEPGEVVVSNLVNRATVVLNYRLGDRARWIPGSCPCGRSLPRMSLPEGRADDWIVRPSGERLHPQAIRTLFTDEERAVRQYRVVQAAPLRFLVEVVAGPDADRAATERRIGEKFRRRLGEGTEAEFRWVDAVERTPGGKVRPFESRIGAGAGTHERE